MNKKIPVYAYYFPNWHVDARNEKWHGTGWTEWDVLRHAVPRYEGHTVYQPLWGMEDEADPKVMEKKIDTALEHGVDGFIWDFYWYKEKVGDGEDAGGFRLNALNNGFFGATNNKKCKIALMLCYEVFGASHPATYWSRFARQTTASGLLNPQEFYEATEYMIKHYFCQENYLRIDDKIYFVIYHTRNFVESMGGVQGARVVLADLRDRVRAAGLGEMMLACDIGYVKSFYEGDGDKDATDEFMKTVGFDSCITYSWPVHPDDCEQWPKIEYKKFVDRGIASYADRTSRTSYPLNITISQGWDPSPRTCPSDKYEQVGYPFDYITANKNPQDFERALRAARDFFNSEESTGQFITLSTWNEWTEGNFMEPSQEDGYAYLEAVKRVFVDEK